MMSASKTDKRFPMKGACLSIYSRAVNAEAPLDEVLGTYFPWCAEWETELRRLFGAYVEAKQKQNVLHYDDLLLYWAQMMVEGAVAQDVADRFDHVLVDEYQDTNRLQASILLARSSPRPMPLSILHPNVSRKTFGRTAPRRSVHISSMWRMIRPRRAISSSRFSKTARRASR
jgi:hypothetical protein